MRNLENIVVMVVEDEPVQRASLLAQLTRIGVCHLLAAEDGVQAIQHLQATAIDLVFCDIGMPNMDGPQFILRQLDDMREGIRDAAHTRNMPMLAWMSVLGPAILASHASMARMAGFGAVAALSKPLAERDVFAVVKSALATRQSQAGNARSLPARLPLSSSDGESDSLLHAICDAREFEVRYQPLLRMDDSCMVGAQAVIRCSSARFANMPPRLLATLIERQGLGLVLFYRTLNHLLKMQVELKKAHREMLLCIEASAHTLLVPELVDYLSERVRLHGLIPACIVVQVGEIGATIDESRLAVGLNRLRIMGFGVYLNDFGKGRANLDLLAAMPFNGVCIDGTLAQRTEVCSKSPLMVEAIARLAGQLQLKVVVNGVDDAAAARSLGAMGCQLGHGRIARPLTSSGLLQSAVQSEPIHCA